MENIPYVTFSKGDKIICKYCGGIHTLDIGKKLDKVTVTWKEDGDVLFYMCGTKTYIASIKGVPMDGVKSYFPESL